MYSEILSPIGNDFCLTFFYHMHGVGMGTLTLYIELVSDTSQLSTLWTVSGEQGDEWKQAQIPVLAVSSEFVLIFEGTIGTTFTSDIAIDDISLSRQSCPGGSSQPMTFTCADQRTVVPISKVCDFVSDCAEGSDEARCGNCTFETDLCGYSDISRGRFFLMLSSILSLHCPIFCLLI